MWVRSRRGKVVLAVAVMGLGLVALGFWAVTGGIWGSRGGLVEGEAIAIAQRLVKEKRPTLLGSRVRWEARYQVGKGAECGQWTVRALRKETFSPREPSAEWKEWESSVALFRIDDCTRRVTDCFLLGVVPVPTWCVRKAYP